MTNNPVANNNRPNGCLARAQNEIEGLREGKT
jgi:hypothetical protein